MEMTIQGFLLSVQNKGSLRKDNPTTLQPSPSSRFWSALFGQCLFLERVGLYGTIFHRMLKKFPYIILKSLSINKHKFYL